MHDDTIVPECDRLPFDAEKARAGEPVCTAEGRRLLGNLAYCCDSRYPLRGRVVGYGERSWAATGCYWASGQPSYNDLRMIRQPVEEAMTEAEAAEAKQCIAPPSPDATPTRYNPAACEPFNRARAEKGEAVYSDAGLPVTILAYDIRRNDDCNIAVLVHYEDHDSCMNVSTDYLRMAPRKPKRWWVVSWGHKYAADGKPASVMYEDEAVARAYHAGLDSCLGAVVSFTDIPE